MRLSNGTSSAEGLLEICFENRRAGVCYEDIDTHTASLLCRELGYDTDLPGNLNYLIVHDNYMHWMFRKSG